MLELQDSITNNNPYIDLGLSVYWGISNLGASVPEESGNYYEWGDIEPRESTHSHKWNRYLKEYIGWNGQSDILPIKYTTQSSSSKFVPDNITQLEPKDDAASTLLGGKWKTPSSFEWNELLCLCKWEVVEKNGVSCFKVTGPSLQCIYFPLIPQKVIKYGTLWNKYSYWTRDLWPYINCYASYAELPYKKRGGLGSTMRNERHFIRPVCEKHPEKRVSIAYNASINTAASPYHIPDFPNLHFYKSIQSISIGSSYYFMASKGDSFFLLDDRTFLPGKISFSDIYRCKGDYNHIVGKNIWVQINRKWGLFSTEKNIFIINPEIDDIEYIKGKYYHEDKIYLNNDDKASDNIFIARSSEHFGLITEHGDTILPFNYDSILLCGNQNSLVSTKHLYIGL